MRESRAECVRLHTSFRGISTDPTRESRCGLMGPKILALIFSLRISHSSFRVGICCCRPHWLFILQPNRGFVDKICTCIGVGLLRRLQRQRQRGGSELQQQLSYVGGRPHFSHMLQLPFRHLSQYRIILHGDRGTCV